jgi:hypothetical protein
MLTSSGACGVGIGFSANRPQAAEIGLPILIMGNILSIKLHGSHPKRSRIASVMILTFGRPPTLPL